MQFHINSFFGLRHINDVFFLYWNIVYYMLNSVIVSFLLLHWHLYSLLGVFHIALFVGDILYPSLWGYSDWFSLGIRVSFYLQTFCMKLLKIVVGNRSGIISLRHGIYYWLLVLRKLIFLALKSIPCIN